jgi:3-deoxy-manno-octulosonate cytidylyltransferase (CMP-KDO synthetase)
MGSTRFPGKPLVDLLGKTMVQRVYEAAIESNVGDQVVVATPDPEIMEACESFGATGVLTRHDHITGTDRIAEVAEKIVAEVYVNVQGDEPLIQPSSIAACAEPLLHDPSIQMGSVFCDCLESEENDPSAVKVVTDESGFALYFSRCPIPFPRNPRQVSLKKHLGLYAFRRDPLMQFSKWQPTALELTESLEQLRFLGNGIRIKMSMSVGAELAIDTPEQADEVRRILASREGGAVVS